MRKLLSQKSFFVLFLSSSTITALFALVTQSESAQPDRSSVAAAGGYCVQDTESELTGADEVYFVSCGGFF